MGYRKYKKQSKYQGNSLESYIVEYIDKFMKQYPKKFFGIKIEVKKSRGAYAKKGPCDFILNTVKGNWLLEAKECSSDKLYLSKIPEHQKHSLSVYKHINDRNTGAFIVWFMTGENSEFYIDVINKRIRYIEDFENKSYFTPNDGIPFSFDIFF